MSSIPISQRLKAGATRRLRNRRSRLQKVLSYEMIADAEVNVSDLITTRSSTKVLVRKSYVSVCSYLYAYSDGLQRGS